MRNCKKNQRTMFYALYGNKIPILDDNGFEELEYKIGYEKPVVFKASLSSGQSEAEADLFGTGVKYDRVISTADTSLPIDENSLIWVKNKPTYNADGTVDESSADYKVSGKPLDGLKILRIPITRRVISNVENIEDNVHSSTDVGNDEGF